MAGASGGFLKMVDHNAARAGIRFGVNAKLQIAFGLVAVLTVIAAAVAITSFSATERGVARVAGYDVPVMTDALRLSAVSGEISAAAARVVSARTAGEQKQISDTIESKNRQLGAIMERLRANQNGTTFASVEAASRRLGTNLKALEAAISERSQLRERLEGDLDAVHKLHARISEKLTPIVDDSYFDVMTSAEDVGKISDKTVKSLVNDGLQLMQAMVEIGAETNLVTGLLTAGALTSSPGMLALLEDRFSGSALRAQKRLAKLPADEKFSDLKQQVAALVALADFKARAAPADGDRERLDRIFRVHEKLTGLLIGLVDDLNFDLVLQSDAAVKRTSKLVKGLVDQQIAELRSALEIAAQSHLLTSLISEGATARDSSALVPLQDRFKAAADLLQKASGRLAGGDVKKLVGDLIGFGQGGDSLFGLRGRELAAASRADQTIADNVAIQHELDAAVATLLGEAEASMSQGIGRLMEELGRNRSVLLVVAVLSMFAAAGIGVFYVQRRLMRRLTSIGDAMHRLAAGETDLAVPAAHDRDELGDMARALEIFRAGEIERRSFAESRDAEQAAQRRRAVAIEQMIGEFRTAVGAAIGAVGDNVGRMEATARALSGIAADAERHARSATASSETTSANVHTVAGATDELGSSINEISEQANQANCVVERAATIARNANERIGQLIEAANRIGDVIKLIRAVAEQTNLLALNATIEAARAGEAGRGFAVVAAEVKSLANQTSKATEEIAAHIGAIQESTSEAVEAIRSIGDVMGDISRFTTTIAAAVEEQSSATREIARNVQEAATGARELAGSVTTVTTAIDKTNHSADQVLEASGALSAEAGDLQQAIDLFLQKVAAA
jgi:methyl-accepting chemotaxis protein